MRTTLKLSALLLGLLTMTSSGEPAHGFIIAPRLTGAQVTVVGANTPAARLGLEMGDVIVAIDGLPIRVPADFPALLDGKARALLTVRDGRTGTYVQRISPVVNGRIGIRFVIATVPERAVPVLVVLGR
jgi:S1-C subfamily serine protease